MVQVTRLAAGPAVEGQSEGPLRLEAPGSQARSSFCNLEVRKVRRLVASGLAVPAGKFGELPGSATRPGPVPGDPGRTLADLSPRPVGRRHHPGWPASWDCRRRRRGLLKVHQLRTACINQATHTGPPATCQACPVRPSLRLRRVCPRRVTASRWAHDARLGSHQHQWSWVRRSAVPCRWACGDAVGALDDDGRVLDRSRRSSAVGVVRTRS